MLSSVDRHRSPASIFWYLLLVLTVVSAQHSSMALAGSLEEALAPIDVELVRFFCPNAACGQARSTFADLVLSAFVL